MTQVAIISAKGLGDGLLMMIVAHQLKKAGKIPTLFHHSPKELSSLFPDVTICPHPSLEELSSFESVIVENDHSERAYALDALRKKEGWNHVRFLFPTPSPLFQKGDFLFDRFMPVASNLHLACQSVLGIIEATKENGIMIPEGKTHRRFLSRVVLHPTSQDPKRNWHQKQFLKLANTLRKEGHEVAFSVGPSERSDWTFVQKEGFALPSFVTLKELAAYLYESGYLIGNDSGIGHLASNLNIPTLTISGNPKRVAKWRPDWANGEVVTLPFPLPNFKGIRLPIRENFWQHFISISRTLRAFHRLKKYAL